MSPATPELGRPEVILGLDVGLRRVGLAVGDTVTRTARPLAAVSRGEELQHIDALARQHAIRRIVVGCPYNVDGSEHALAPGIRVLATQLRARTGLPVQLVDERYSSLEAEAALRERRADGTRRARIDRGAIDSAAAAIILERWLTGEHGTNDGHIE